MYGDKRFPYISDELEALRASNIVSKVTVPQHDVTHVSPSRCL